MPGRFLIRYDICFYKLQTPFAKPLLHPHVLRTIFALYLQCHASKTVTAKANYILFYALCFLYMLSVATIAFDIVSFVVITSVSNNEHLFLSKKKKKNNGLISGWAECRYRLRHRYRSIHIIRLLRLHRPVHPSTLNL